MALLKREYHTKIFEGMFFAQMQRYSSFPAIGSDCIGEVIKAKSGKKGIFRSSDYSFTVNFIGDRMILVRQNPFFLGVLLVLLAVAIFACIIVIPFIVEMATSQLKVFSSPSHIS